MHTESADLVADERTVGERSTSVRRGAGVVLLLRKRSLLPQNGRRRSRTAAGRGPFGWMPGAEDDERATRRTTTAPGSRE
jgi:hypothetical protein